MFAPLVILLGFVSLITSQTTYTGCHNESAATALIEWCYGPNGFETPLLTFTTSAPSTLITRTTGSPASTSVSTTATGQTTAVTGCHTHDTHIYCINGAGQEVSVSATGTNTPPPQYTGCHAHGNAQYCLDPDGGEVLVVSEDAGESAEMDCHFHAGVEHCVAVGTSESSTPVSCERRYRDYDIPIRVGTLFAVLFTSALGVFLPVCLEKFASGKISINGLLFTFLKQFGTGVIIATAFVHLYTHASLMFGSECLGRLSYEATTSAIVMAGLFLSFLIEYISRRLLVHYNNRSTDASQSSSVDRALPTKQPMPQTAKVNHHEHHGEVSASNNKISVIILEAGIIFHSLILGLTLVVAGDSAYITLFIVIVFHQFFEGLALGSRIAALPTNTIGLWPTKVLMATAFSLVTPVGMAIGIGVLRRFNGNDPSTIIAIGTLDAVSAGILIWVGVVEMWTMDWIVPGGDMVDAGILKATIGGVGLVAGLLLMSVLGKWA